MQYITIAVECDHTGLNGVYTKLVDRLSSGEADGYKLVKIAPYGEEGTAQKCGIHALLVDQSA